MTIRGFAGIRAFACLLVTLLGAAVSAFAQTHLANLSATEPTFLALDTRGGTTWLYVSEHGDVSGTPPANGGRVLRYDLTAGSTTPQVVATRGTANGQFISPDSILVDSATGDIFVSDRYQNKVQRLSVNATTGVGTFVMGWGTATTGAPDEMQGPVGLARDAAGAIYISEHGAMNGGGGGNMVSKYTVTSSAATRVWRKGNSFSTPYGVAVSGSTLLISDGFNAQVQIWDLNGNPTGSFALPGIIPTGLSIDSSGGLWIAESSGGGTGPTEQVEKRTITGTPAGVSFGTQGSADGQFSLPFHAVLNSATNRLYVADYSNNRVQVFDMATTPPPAAPTITSSTSASGTVGTAFSYTITASGSPTSYNATGLPAGLSVNTSTGVISGTPTAAGPSSVTISATNASGTGNATLNISVAASGGGGDTTAPTISSFTLDLGTATATHARYIVTFSENVIGVDAADFAANTQGNAGVSNIAVTGSGTTYHVDFDYTGTNGSIQMGIRTAASTNIADTAGNAFVGGGATASDTVSVNNTPPADMTIPTVSTFTVGTPAGSSVNFTLTFSEPVTGVTADDFFSTRTGTATATIGTITGSGTTYTIPVTFGGTGTIQLTVVGGVTSNIRDAATNWYAGGGTSATFTIGSGGGGSAPTIANQTVSGTVGTAVNYQVAATGATSFSIVGGTLPAGLSMSTSGAVTGTPTATANSTVTVRATNANGSTDASLTFNIAASGGGGSAPTIGNQTVSGTVGTAVNYQVVASGATSITLNSGSSLPAGLSMSSSGAITGTPTAAGSSTASIRATNANGSTNATLTFNIAASGGGGSAPTISNQTVSGTAGVALNYQVQATGATSFSIVGGALPSGVAMSTSGAVTGTASAGSTTVTVRATNANGTADASLTFNIAAAGAAPTIANQTASGNINSAFNYQVVATGATSYSIVGGTLPAGLSLSSSGAITGSPTQAGTYNVTVMATNANGSAQANLALSISSTPAPTSPPTIADQVVTATASRFFDYVIQATGATSISVVPPSQLPYALTLSPQGRLAGIPTTPGSTVVTIKATNAAGSSTAQLTINVGNPPSLPPPPAKTSQTITFNSPVSAVRVGVPIQLGATTTSGLPITYTVISGSATISGSTLTPTGTSALTVRAAQAGNDTYAAASTDVNFGTPAKAAQTITFSAPKPALVTDTTVQLSATSSSGLPITYTLVSGPAILTGSTLTLTGDQGVIIVKASQAGNDTVTAAADVSVLIPVWMAPGLKVMGLGSEVGADIVHPNGNVYDQILMSGGYVSVTADPGQITRVSFIDLTDDIVQVEFSGAGTLSIVLDNPTGPAVATKYNQSNVSYMKGHANISVTGANETTNLSVFSVGTATAVNQSLFPAGMTYDAMADIGLISISSTNGKFGGLRTANASYTGASGMIGISAPGVTFTGPVFIGDISAGANATGMIVIGSATDLRVTGGDLLQLNSRPIQVNGITNISFTAGTKSNGVMQPAQTNQAQFERNGADVTTQIVTTQIIH